MSSLDFLDAVLSETLTEEEYLQERRARSESSASTVQAVLTNVKLFCIDQAQSDFGMVNPRGVESQKRSIILLGVPWVTQVLSDSDGLILEVPTFKES